MVGWGGNHGNYDWLWRDSWESRVAGWRDAEGNIVGFINVMAGWLARWLDDWLGLALAGVGIAVGWDGNHGYHGWLWWGSRDSRRVG